MYKYTWDQWFVPLNSYKSIFVFFRHKFQRMLTMPGNFRHCWHSMSEPAYVDIDCNIHRLSTYAIFIDWLPQIYNILKLKCCFFFVKIQCNVSHSFKFLNWIMMIAYIYIYLLFLNYIKFDKYKHMFSMQNIVLFPIIHYKKC